MGIEQLDSIASIIRMHREERPDAVAIVQDGVEHTWRELDSASNRLASALAGVGVGAGDRIARIEKNGVDYFQLLFATAKLNAVLVDVNWRLAPPEMRHIVDDSGAHVLFVGTEFLGALDDIESDLATVSTTVVVGDGGGGRVGLADFMASGSDTDPGVVAGPNDLCLQL